VEVLAWDGRKGTLTSLQKNSLVPEGYKGDHTGAEIVFDRDGHFAYAADRFDNVIVSFKIDTETGKLTALGHTAYGGKTPRHIALDPSGHWLLIANQDSDTISVRSRDAKTGLIAETGKDFDLSKPQCLVFL
jgi:6-phosphogluconolactonase